MAATTAVAAVANTDRADAAVATAPLVGSQLFGWGQYYQRDGKKLAEHLGDVLSAVRDAGYDYAETSFDGNNPEKNVQLAEQMKARGLKPVSLYMGGAFHEAGRSHEAVAQYLAAAKAARSAGFTILNCNPQPLSREKTDEELKTQAESLAAFGDGLNKIGMRLGIHHHTPEFRSQGREYHHIFHHTRAESVGYCYDVHWAFRGGVPPTEALKEYGARIVSWHLRQSRGGIWWEDLDKGDLDYGLIARFAREHQLPPLYTVELALEKETKITRGVVENHRRSREFVRNVFLA